MTLAEKLESRDFYELCQQYRFGILMPTNTGYEDFEAIKKYLLTGELPWTSYGDAA